VFAPTNRAFAKLPPSVLEYLTDDANVGDLQSVLKYHVLASKVLSSEIIDGAEVSTLLGDDATLTFSFKKTWSWQKFWWDRGLFINDDSQVIITDIEASNGVIHVIDEVLIPPDFSLPIDLVDTAVGAGLTVLATAAKFAGLVDTLRSTDTDYTVFAPTNEAFGKLPPAIIAYLLRSPDALEKVLLHHVVIGAVVPASNIVDGSVTEAQTAFGEPLSLSVVDSGVVINSGENDEAKVIIADVRASNGIAHVIDTVLVPDDLEIPGTIVDAVASRADLSTLFAVVQAAGLGDALSGDLPLTVFAPSNDAIAALGEEKIAALLADPEGELTDILKYHVAPGILTSDEIIEHAPFPVFTLNKGLVKTKVDGGSVLLEDSTEVAATVTEADIDALNGVVHVIDKVLIPAAECPYPKFWCWILGY